MARRALADALVDFAAAPPLAPAPVPYSLGEFGPGSGMENPEPVELPDIDGMIAAAVTEAEAALAERLSQEHAEALEAQRERHAAELAELTNQLAAEASARVASRIQEMEERIVELTTSVTARILGMTLTEELRDRSIESLGRTIHDALLDDEAVRIKVRGPVTLYEALKAAMPAHAGHLDFAESPGMDLSVSIDGTIFETRLADWRESLAEALS
ncbi:hypothetical protein [Aquamicrobium sp. LC103]|uniref:hypothetical protein n=1 Tax=Aquamicrobium sp. LC103 TaxID=1120658 RepID=UPI00063E895A|nr:hypothetical protein [Aquamicrobium sp. LC103]TKT77492.1 hypothetical protein XW59_013560 [Aquamicrobium sp. LC103]